ncbi:MarR family winged helix-turn-helix transcriptional regulator [Pseudosulfitobacter koreensis]|uniref:MarR family winged helix-turn-helix transcriptional regulator n=1 Tax=Pseudosulfitobacter koreensis TaxID=2968472 RepID=A0ABT1YVT8_9RHOB|nr:MarR family winged helix-turn-helix transcriptional regulator [Pseudosulfitobacter koreense]MCR8825003.1 MarR family winged helix-turn-helix transcriptional regulator [Pseudosulfitobacter koreense]
MADTDIFDLQAFLPYLLNQAAEASSLDFQSVYKSRYGMLRNEWRVLFHLGMYGRLSASEIRDRSGLHKTKISRAVQRLAERRFLTRDRDTRDRRTEHLELTAQGQAAYRDLRKIAQEYDAALADMLGNEDVAALRRMLKRLAQRVS